MLTGGGMDERLARDSLLGRAITGVVFEIDRGTESITLHLDNGCEVKLTSRGGQMLAEGTFTSSDPFAPPAPPRPPEPDRLERSTWLGRFAERRGWIR